MKNNISKHIKFSKVHEDIVNEMIDTIPGINSFSEAVRYAVLSMDGQTDRQKEHNAMKRKQNAMSKNIDVLLEIVSSGFHEQKVALVTNKEDTYVYRDALNIVENNIQRATTERSAKL